MSEEQLDPQKTPSPTPPPFNSNPFPPDNGGYPGMQQSLPNATIVLVLGIVSIVSCCCFYGFVALITSIVALVLSKKDRALYLAYPGAYTESSFKNLNAGRVCAIIGLIFAAIIVIASVIFIATFGYEALTDQEKIKEMLQNMQ